MMIDARQELEATRRLEGALARLGAEHLPPLGWEARVLAAARPRTPRWRYAAPGLAAAALAALCVAQLWPTEPPLELALDMAVRHRVPVRGTEGQVGDVVHIRVTGGDGERAIWVYCDEQQLVLRCPGDPGCQASGAEMSVDLALGEVATYTVVALSARGALPAPSGRYDDDTAAARRAGAAVRADSVTVR